MADDPISSFRERFTPKKDVKAPPPAPALVVDRTREREPYEALGTKDKSFRFDVRCTNGLAHSLAYTYLLNVSYDRRAYSAIFLTISGLTVTIKGKALRPIVDALKLHTCEFIQAFDPEEFAEPHDPTAPYVQSIDVEVMRGGAPPKEEAEEERA
jgi:hypothetical protein